MPKANAASTTAGPGASDAQPTTSTELGCGQTHCPAFQAYLARLLERLDTAAYRTEGLIGAADLVADQLLSFVREHLGPELQDNECLAFLIDEARHEAGQARDLLDELTTLLKQRPHATIEEARS